MSKYCITCNVVKPQVTLERIIFHKFVKLVDCTFADINQLEKEIAAKSIKLKSDFV